MNKERRKKIQILLNDIKVVLNEIDKIKTEEEMSYDNIPENLLDSMRATESEEAIEILNEAYDQLEEIYNNINEM